MEAILDTNFLISCVIKRIDFVEELKAMGFTAVVPREVMEELKDLKKESKTSHADRTAIDVVFEIIEKENMKKIRLGAGKVDAGLIKKGKSGIYIATLDNGIKRQIPNKIIISGARNALEIEKD